MTNIYQILDEGFEKRYVNNIIEKDEDHTEEVKANSFLDKEKVLTGIGLGITSKSNAIIALNNIITYIRSANNVKGNVRSRLIAEIENIIENIDKFFM